MSSKAKLDKVIPIVGDSVRILNRGTHAILVSKDYGATGLWLIAPGFHVHLKKGEQYEDRIRVVSKVTEKYDILITEFKRDIKLIEYNLRR